MDRSISAPQKVANTVSEWVWYDGTGALLEGQGVCYEFDYYAPVTSSGVAAETGTEVDARRTNRVVLPDIHNGKWFAGVCAADYPAAATGQLIQIYCPGSTCNILAKFNATLGAGIVTCQAGGALAGYFTKVGFMGAGSAYPLQTIDRSTTAGKISARLLEGEQSSLVEVLAPTDAAYTYKTAGTTVTVPAGTGTAGGARQSKVGGVTYYEVATNAAAITSTLADGTRVGEKKRFVIDGTQTTTGVTLTVTNGKKLDQTTSITTITGSTAARSFYCEWVGGYWMTRYDDFDTIS